jgi:hypothetical protein
MSELNARGLLRKFSVFSRSLFGIRLMEERSEVEIMVVPYFV